MVGGRLWVRVLRLGRTTGGVSCDTNGARTSNLGVAEPSVEAKSLMSSGFDNGGWVAILLTSREPRGKS